MSEGFGSAAIRIAGAHDADAIAALWHDTWHATHAQWTPGELVAHRDGNWFLAKAIDVVRAAFVAQRGTRIVGFVAWRGDQLYQLFVDQSERGHGTAGALLSSAEEAMKISGTEQAFLNCRIQNDPARRFYEKHGWMRDARTTLSVRGLSGPQSVVVWRMVKRLGV
jgi:GNAT superfamily N-acetyltransferase